MHLFFNKTSLYALWPIVATTYLLAPFVFLCSLLSTKNEYISGLDPTNPLVATSPVLSFIFPMTNLFQLS